MAKESIIDAIKVKTADSDTTYSVAMPWVITDTAVGTQAKVPKAIVPGLTLDAGTQIQLKLTNGNSHASPTLNVNSLGAKSIVGYGPCTPANFSTAGSIMKLVYDGTN